MNESIVPPSPYAGNGVLQPPAPRPAEPHPPSLRLTAAVPSKDVLSVVTLSWTGKYLRLVPSQTDFFYLASEDQHDVQQFYHSLLGYFTEHGIRQILVRRGPGTGPQSVCTGTIRMAAALQMMPFACPEIHVQSVVGWARSTTWLLPLPQRGFRAVRRKLQSRAIETAAYGIAKYLEACTKSTAVRIPDREPGPIIDAA